MSQTYYSILEKQKKYVQELIINHELLKDLNFWEQLFDLHIVYIIGIII